MSATETENIADTTLLNEGVPQSADHSITQKFDGSWHLAEKIVKFQ